MGWSGAAAAVAQSQPRHPVEMQPGLLPQQVLVMPGHPSLYPALWDPPEMELQQAHCMHPACCEASTATVPTPSLAPQERPAWLLHWGRADPALGSAGREPNRVLRS